VGVNKEVEIGAFKTKLASPKLKINICRAWMLQATVLPLALEGGAGLVDVFLLTLQTILAMAKLIVFAEFTDNHFHLLFLKLKDTTTLITQKRFSCHFLGLNLEAKLCLQSLFPKLGTQHYYTKP
jgi:hypothetical protein